MIRNDSSEKLVVGYRKAFIDSSIESESVYCPQLVSNGNGKKVLSVIEQELKECDSLFISVAFITMGGIAPLLGTLKELEEKETKGKIITTDYLLFSDPKALDKLNSFSNIELKVFKTGEHKVGFHTKGYMFHNDGNLRILVGSSNLTQDAITKNHEWNTRLVSTTNGQFAKDVQSEFNDLWDSSVCYSTYKEEYTELYNKSAKERHELSLITRTLDLSNSQVLLPNVMQQKFIFNIEEILQSKGKRALLISATGTGKTFASAFAIRDICFRNLSFDKKVLFLSHREQINKQALISYKRVFGKFFQYELLSGNNNDIEEAKSAHFLFSTMNMMAKDDIRSKFSSTEYSVIVLDECHRSGANSYQKIINYFQPKLLLGMSASPERTDDFDVFGLFDHNIACEIRLQQALENDMLCPFHYFGITDFIVNQQAEDVVNFGKLVSDKRVDHITKMAEYYGYSGSRVKGLIFCSTKKEAAVLSEKFNFTNRFKTIALSGENSQEEREQAIERLVSEKDDNNSLDYIFTVDIFNEGVDIPEINQIIMLRPTESPIIFVQQMGRGLRKTDEKEFVVIIDFIGNYQNNYMIPIALSGDRSGNKDNLRRYLMEGNNVIQGASSVYFDEISRDRIYRSIDTANLNQIQILKKEYFNLKNKLGRIPKLKDFDELGELDPLRIIDKCDSYNAFLSSYEPDYTESFSAEQLDILKFVSKKFASGMRIHELSLLKLLISRPSENVIRSIAEDGKIVSLWRIQCKQVCGIEVTDNMMTCVISVLTGQFFRMKDSPILIKTTSDDFELSDSLCTAISDSAFKNTLIELIDFGIERYKKDYAINYQQSSFNLYKKYTYSEVCWLLNWKREEVSLNIGGYKYDRYSNTYPVFINYEKAEDVNATTRYEDRFIDQSSLIAISKSNRTIESDDIVNAVNSVNKHIWMPLFVRKNKDDMTSKEFYFLGNIEHNGYLKEIIMPGTTTQAVEIGYKLTTPVESNLYEFITEKSL